MHSQPTTFELARFVSTAAGLAIGLGVTMGGLLVGLMAVLEAAGAR